jgi:hypothetical protein
MPKKAEDRLVAVVIPVYKEIPDANELVSLGQVIKILKAYPVIFFAPQSLNTIFYEDFCAQQVSFQIRRFADKYFRDISGYNKLMLSKQFYRGFTAYKFIFVHQLDAYVFRDELDNWCRKGYDYIGAPYTFVDMDIYPIKVLTKYRALLKAIGKYLPWFYAFKQVGNGGLSLRNVKKTLLLLNFKSINPHLWTVLMEDNFFQYWGNLAFPFFRLPDVGEAARFSIELDAEKTFNAIGNKLPFGCHAYARYEPGFWKNYIDIKN